MMNTEHVQRQPQRVLIIHSEEPLVEFLKLGLRYEGFQVEAVAEGATGLAAASQEVGSIIIRIERRIKAETRMRDHSLDWKPRIFYYGFQRLAQTAWREH
jgi:hypothetical protein